MLRQLRAVLVVVLVFGPIGTAAAAPDGMVGVPDANVTDDLPAEARGELPGAAAFRGSVMASTHSDTLEVGVTTRGRAFGAAVAEQARSGGEPELAIQLTDDTHSESRQVALPVAPIENATGRVPQLAYVTNDETGEQWTLPVERQGSLLVLEIPHFSTNTITWSGLFSITAEPATDGSQFTYEQAETPVSSYSINVTGSTSYETDSVSGVFANGSSTALSIAGTADPTTADVTFTGRETLFGETRSGADVGDGGTASVSVSGDDAPQNADVTFTGRQSTGSRYTPSGTGDTSLTVAGDAAPSGPNGGEPEITFTGRESTTARTLSGSVAPGGSDSISPGGNLDPTGPSASNNPEVTVTGHAASSSLYDTTFDEGDGGVFGQTYNNHTQKSEWQVNSPPATINALKLDYDQRADSSTWYVDVYIVSEGVDTTYGEGTLVKSGWHPDGSVSEETLRLDTAYATGGNTVTIEFITTATAPPPNGDNHQFTVQIDEYSDATPRSSLDGNTDDYAGAVWAVSEPRNVQVSASDGTSATVGDLADGQTKTVEFDVSEAASSVTIDADGGNSLDYALDLTERTGTEDPSVDVDGDGSADASYSGVLASGETAAAQQLAALPAGAVALNTWTAAGPTPAWALTYDEELYLHDPSVDVDGDGTADGSHSGVLAPGETATVGVSGLTTGSQTLAFGTDGGRLDWALAYDRVEYSEDPSVDVDGDGTADGSVSGVLAPGETATASVSGLTLSSSSMTVTTAAETDVEANLTYQEVTETIDPVIEVNGNTTSHTGTLADGETVSLTADPAWVQQGTNLVNVSVTPSVGADAPTPQVGLSYYHTGVDDQDVTYDAEKFSERYNVSKTFGQDQADAQVTIPFQATVYSIRNVEMQVNGGGWQEVTDYSLSGTELTAGLGTVAAGDTVEVRATGSKVVVQNGALSVQEPTMQGADLDSEIRLESWGDDAYISVGGTEDGHLIHDTVQETWESPETYVRVTDTGTQQLFLPGAQAGDSTRVQTLPLEIAPQSGDAHVAVVDAGTPEVAISPGNTLTDDLLFRYHDTVSGEYYELYSVTRGRQMDAVQAHSPVELEEDDSEETFVIRAFDPESSSASGGAGGGSWELTSEPSLRAYAMVAGIWLLILGLAYASGTSRLIGERTRWIVLGVLSILGALFSFEILNPGAISGAVGSGLSDLVSFAGLAAIGIVVYSVYSWWEKRKTEAATPETSVSFDLQEGGK